MGRFANFAARLKRTVERTEVRERADAVGDILYGRYSAYDYEGTKAVAELVTALCNNKCCGVCDGGVYIFYKIKNEDGDFQIFHKRLTLRERELINKYPTLLKDPYKLLEKMEEGLALEKQRAEQLRAIATGSDG